MRSEKKHQVTFEFCFTAPVCNCIANVIAYYGVRHVKIDMVCETQDPGGNYGYGGIFFPNVV